LQTLEQETLEQENRYLKKQLDLLLKNAHDNQLKQQRFEQFEFELMSAESIEAVLHCLEVDFPQLFNYEASSLILVNQHFSLSHLLPEAFLIRTRKKFLQLLNFPLQRERIDQFSDTIYAGRYSAIQHHGLLQHSGVKSIAVFPLIRRGKTFGIFCCGTRDENRFEPGLANDFFKRLAFIISVCIENALNREKLKLGGLTDPLTKIRNRRFFDQRLRDEINRHERVQTPLSCILFDIDHFKQVNDTHGHLAGDDILVEVTSRVQEVLRKHEILARYGGEEFAVLLPDTTNEAAKFVAQRVLFAINRNSFSINSEVSIKITVSAGIATLPAEKYHGLAEILANNLVASADDALYKAKEQGRNREINAGTLSITKTVEQAAVLV
jgi:diguanylate cyclase (GGDEF)-like protein